MSSTTAIGRTGITPLGRIGRFLGVRGALTPELQRDLARNATKMLLIGKWTHTIGGLVLVGSGMLRVPLPRFILVNLLATVPKSAVLFGFGYFAGDHYPFLERHYVLVTRRPVRRRRGGHRARLSANRPRLGRPMRIAMFTDYFFPELGGIQDSIATISRSLGGRGHQVDIYAPRYAAADYRRIGVPMRERDLGDNVRVRRRLSLPFPSSTRQSRAALPSPIAPAVLAVPNEAGRDPRAFVFRHRAGGAAERRRLGIPVIGTNHTTIAGFGPHIPISVDRAGAYVTWFHNRCDYVTAPSQSVFAELGLAKLRRPHQVISNPIDTVLFAPARPAERETLAGAIRSDRSNHHLCRPPGSGEEY